MMANFQIQRFLKQKLISWRLYLAWIVTCCFFIKDAAAVAAQIQLRVEIGGNLTFRCPDVKSKPVDFFYFQKNHTFINGYHTSKNSSIKTWSNTKMDHKDRTTVHMFNVNASHGGDYECHIKYSSYPPQPPIIIKVNVTANYSKPQTIQWCPNEHNCEVDCISHGGYPSIKMTWDVPESHVWKLKNNSEIQDPDTMMVNSSSTASFNCSSGELTIRCHVGSSTSDTITVCKQNLHGIPVIATSVTVAILFACIVLWICKCKKRKRGTAGESNQLSGESICLSNKQEKTAELRDKTDNPK